MKLPLTSVRSFSAAVAAIILAGSAIAQPAIDQAMRLAPFIERDIGLTREQFRAYLDKEAIAQRAQGEIADFVGERAFGGFIMHRREDNSYENRVLLTDLSHIDEARKLGADAVVQVKYSLATLYANHASVLRTIEQLQVWPLVTGVGIDVAANKIVLEIKPERLQVGQSIIAASGFLPDLFVVKPREQSPPATINIWAAITCTGSG